MDSAHPVFDGDGEPADPPTLPRPREHRSGRRGRTSTTDRTAIRVVAAVAALLAALAAGGSPTGIEVVDALWRGLLAGAVTLLGARARRWSWLVSAGAVTVAAGAGAWLAVGLGGLVLAIVGAARPRRRLVGAVVAAVCVQVALHLPDFGWFPAATLAAVAALAPIVVSGARHLPRAVVRPVRRWAPVAAGAVVVVVGLAGLSAVLAIGPAQDGREQAERGYEAARSGDVGRAATELSAAASSFEAADRWAGGWWTLPARVVPVVSQHVEALGVATQRSAEVVRAAATSADQVDPDALRYVEGRLDLEQVRTAAPVLEAAAEAVTGAGADLVAVSSPWLLPMLADPLGDLTDLALDAEPGAQTAAAAVRELPSMLGGEETRRYLVLFTQPAEARGAGGFVGSWAVLTAEDGAVRLTDSGRAADVNETPGRDERTVSGPPDYVARWGRFDPGSFFQDVTLSPDVPSVAQAATEVFAAAGKPVVDGVIVVDPYALARLLEITGPIRVEGLSEPLTADTAADWLVRRQYLELPDDEVRVDLLEQLSRSVLEELTTGDLPSGRLLVDLLGSSVAEGRLALWAFDDGAGSLLDRMGASGRLRPNHGQDLIGLVTQNAGNNKIDVFLHRTLTYDARVNPEAGVVEARVAVTLRNDAPASGLPLSVIGSNDRGLPLGTNRMHVSLYSPLGLREARIDGSRVPFEAQRELGWSAYSTFLEVPPGATVTLELLLTGSIEPMGIEGTYTLDVLAQPLVNPDEVSVRIRPELGWSAIPGPQVGDGPVSTATDEGVEATVAAEQPFRILTELLRSVPVP